MNLFVIGSGGREHALSWKLAQSPHVTRMWCAPGNAGIAAERCSKNQALVECVPIAADDLPALLAFALEHQPALTVVGPDNPLALGIVDLFQNNRLRIWGPNRQAAQFEASKAFAQDFMQRHGIPTARSASFTQPAAARRFATSLQGRCVVKADGLALGKGVIIASTDRDADKAITDLMINETFGAAGRRIVIQEFLEGMEVSLHAICDGATAALFPVSQDHKRALDGDRGLNTGGMGAYCPAPFVSDSELTAIKKAILDPWLAGCASEGIDFRGILYPGIMLTDSGPKVLEFNARFGDPETQAYLALLENDLVELLEASATGTLAKIELKWRPMSSVCVVMASGGYPGVYSKDKIITGLDDAAALQNTKVFHAGTRQAGENILTCGGRVLGVTSWAPTLAAARDAVAIAVNKIKFDGAHWRTDIAAKALR